MPAARIEMAAKPESAAVARGHVATALADSPRKDDAVQVASEFVAEALAQAAVGGLLLTVETGRGFARVTLASTEADRPPREDGSRGLVIADAVADALGQRYSTEDGSSALWAEFRW